MRTTPITIDHALALTRRVLAVRGSSAFVRREDVEDVASQAYFDYLTAFGETGECSVGMFRRRAIDAARLMLGQRVRGVFRRIKGRRGIDKCFADMREAPDANFCGTAGAFCQLEFDELADQVVRLAPPSRAKRVRDIIALRVEGHTLREIGTAIGLSQWAVWSTIRGIQQSIRRAEMFEPWQLAGRTANRVPRPRLRRASGAEDGDSRDPDRRRDTR